MQTTSVKLYASGYAETRTYISAALFVMGNIVLPQLFHLVPQGGMTWLPIYFFTLVGAYKYGWIVGVLTALLSPTVNAAFFGMPLPANLAPIMLKSLLLALAAAYVAHRYSRITIPLLIAVVLSYQVIGTLGEWALKGDVHIAIQDFRIGIPGMLLQVFGGYAFIRLFLRK